MSESTKGIAEPLYKWLSDRVCPSSSLRLPIQESHSQSLITLPSLIRKISMLHTKFSNRSGRFVSTSSRTWGGWPSTSTTFQLAGISVCIQTWRPPSDDVWERVSFSVKHTSGTKEPLTVLLAARGRTQRESYLQIRTNPYSSFRSLSSSPNDVESKPQTTQKSSDNDQSWGR